MASGSQAAGYMKLNIRMALPAVIPATPGSSVTSHLSVQCYDTISQGNALGLIAGGGDCGVRGDDRH